MRLAEVDVAILAGGLGTRLRSVLPGTPKILAPVDGRPFLGLLLGWLARQGVRRVVLCLGYRSADVIDYLRNQPFDDLQIATVTEAEPLGTGGALANAREFLRSNPVLAMNGDTVVPPVLGAFLASHCASSAQASMLCVHVPDGSRYGCVDIDEKSFMRSFVEKNTAAAEPAWINGGCYLFGNSVLDAIYRLSRGSLERDILETLPPGTVHAFRAEGNFLDIGTPETFAAASEVLLS